MQGLEPLTFEGRWGVGGFGGFLSFCDGLPVFFVKRDGFPDVSIFGINFSKSCLWPFLF